MPKVSVLLISMNHALYIGQAVDSLANQDFKDFDIIYLDNLSDDNTAAIALRKLKDAGLNFKHIQLKARQGISKNLNDQVKETKAEFVAILSGDDWWEPNFLSEKLKIAQTSGADFIFSDGWNFDNKTKRDYPAYGKNFKKIKALFESPEAFFHKNVAKNQTVNVGNFIRTELLRKFPFDENIPAEDWEFNLRLAKNGIKFTFLNQKLFHYRIVDNSLSRNWPTMKKAYEMTTQKYIQYIQSHPELYQEYQLNLAYYDFKIEESKAKSETEKKSLKRKWKKRKYTLKHSPLVAWIKQLFI